MQEPRPWRCAWPGLCSRFDPTRHAAARHDRGVAMSAASRRLGNALLPWLLPLGLLAGWQIAASSGWLPQRILPAPDAVLRAAATLVRSGELWQHLAISSWRAAVGLAIGGSIGFALGLLTGVCRVAERLLDSALQMLRNAASGADSAGDPVVRYR